MRLPCSCSNVPRLKWIPERELFLPALWPALELPRASTGSANVPAPVQSGGSTFGSPSLNICLKKEIKKAS